MDKPIIITGPRASGKSFIASAFAQTHRNHIYTCPSSIDSIEIEDIQRSSLVIIDECTWIEAHKLLSYFLVFDRIDPLTLEEVPGSRIPLVFLVHGNAPQDFPFRHFTVIKLQRYECE